MPKTTARLSSAVVRLANGEQTTFREIFDYFSPKVYGFAMKLAVTPADAEELVQEVFLKIWLHRSKLATIANFDAYLFTITRNAAYNHFKRIAIERKARSMYADQMAEHSSGTEESVIYSDYEQFLHGAIEKLSPQQRLIYNLCHREGLKYAEVAEKLQISKLTVKTHMQQALRVIKSQLRHLATTCLFFAIDRIFF
jgi:RNA polymerase sigma-70 factor (family 1)